MPITALAYASGTLTSDATNVTANDTVTVGLVTYTFKASVTTTANEVKIGADAATTLANLKKAIAASDTSVHGSLTVANPLAKGTTLTATTLKIVSKVPGAIGNLIATTEASTHLSFGGTVLSGGTGYLYTAIGELLASEQLNAALIQILKSLDSDSEAN